MPIRAYICPIIGDGASPGFDGMTDANGPFRPRAVRYFDGSGVDRAVAMHLPGHRCLVLVDTSSAEHTAIAADANITPVTPSLADDAAAWKTLLDSTLLSISTATWRNNARTYLEARGINCDWITASTTLRQFLKAMMKYFGLAGFFDGKPDLIAFLLANLDATVGDLTAAQRNAIGNWMDSKGIPTSGITLTTTIRSVQSLIATNLNFAPERGGKFLMLTEEF